MPDRLLIQAWNVSVRPRLKKKRNGCWEFKHPARVKISVDNFKEAPDRLAYRLYKGAVPYGEVIHHTCHRRMCCNPAHLIATTWAEHWRLVKEHRRKHGKP